MFRSLSNLANAEVWIFAFSCITLIGLECSSKQLGETSIKPETVGNEDKDVLKRLMPDELTRGFFETYINTLPFRSDDVSTNSSSPRLSKITGKSMLNNLVNIIGTHVKVLERQKTKCKNCEPCPQMTCYKEKECDSCPLDGGCKPYARNSECPSTHSCKNECMNSGSYRRERVEISFVPHKRNAISIPIDKSMKFGSWRSDLDKEIDVGYNKKAESYSNKSGIASNHSARLNLGNNNLDARTLIHRLEADVMSHKYDDELKKAGPAARMSRPKLKDWFKILFNRLDPNKMLEHSQSLLQKLTNVANLLPKQIRYYMNILLKFIVDQTFNLLANLCYCPKCQGEPCKESDGCHKCPDADHICTCPQLAKCNITSDMCAYYSESGEESDPPSELANEFQDNDPRDSGIDSINTENPKVSMKEKNNDDSVARMREEPKEDKSASDNSKQENKLQERTSNIENKSAIFRYQSSTVLKSEYNETIECNIPQICNLRKTCGNPRPFINPKMNGGEDVKKNEWPFFVYITIMQDSSYFSCSGVIIAPNLVMTAAHCVTIDGKRLDPSAFEVSAGFFEMHEMLNKRKVKQVIISDANFVGDPSIGLQYDYAILVLDKDYESSESIKFACLPFEPIDVSKSYCYLIGGGKVPNQFQVLVYPEKVQKMAVVQTSCSKWNLRDDDRTRICFTKKGGPGDSCEGDSGGPILCRSGPHRTYKIVGLTSYGSQDCDGKTQVEFVGVYTNVRYILKDIQANMARVLKLKA